MLDGGKPLPPAMSQGKAAWHRMARSYGAEPCIGRDLEKIMKDSGHFSEINVKKVLIPISQKSTG
jgi:hypothetical protein